MTTEKRILFAIILVIIFALIFAIILGSIVLKPSEIITKTKTFPITVEIIIEKTKTIAETIEKTITETYTIFLTTTEVVSSEGEEEENYITWEEFMKKIYATLGQAVKFKNWEITVNEVKRVNGIIVLDSTNPTLGNVYKPTKENYDLFLVNILVKNIGKKADSISIIWNYSVITEDYAYKRKYSSSDLTFIDRWEVEVLSKKYPEYPIINEFNDLKTLDPEEEYSSWIIFELLKDKIVKEITFNINRETIHIKL
jgi:hypothetical protein